MVAALAHAISKGCSVTGAAVLAFAFISADNASIYGVRTEEGTAPLGLAASAASTYPKTSGSGLVFVVISNYKKNSAAVTIVASDGPGKKLKPITAAFAKQLASLKSFLQPRM